MRNQIETKKKAKETRKVEDLSRDSNLRPNDMEHRHGAVRGGLSSFAILKFKAHKNNPTK